jgi:hypothetical protein
MSRVFTIEFVFIIFLKKWVKYKFHQVNMYIIVNGCYYFTSYLGTIYTYEEISARKELEKSYEEISARKIVLLS